MIYSAWYFCTTINLSVLETSEVLHAIQALETPRASFVEKMRAVRSIETMNPTVQIRMIPYLVRLLLSEEMRTALNAHRNAAEQRELLLRTTELLMQLVPNAGKSGAADLISSLPEMTAEDAGKYAIACRPGEPDEEAGATGADFTGYALELLLLSVLECVGETERVLVETFVRGGDSDLIQNAAVGSYGQLCRSLALKLQLRSGVAKEEVLHSMPRGWISQPDFLEIAAEAFFPASEGRQASEAILKEAGSLKLFSAQWRLHEQDAKTDWLAIHGSRDDDLRCILVLWQAILFELALEQYPPAFMHSAAPLLCVPALEETEGAKRIRIYPMQKLLLPDRVGFSSVRALRNTVCSPWQIRSEATYNKNYSTKPGAAQTEAGPGIEECFHDFLGFRLCYNGLRAFCAVHLLQKLYRRFGTGVQAEYTALLMNLGDAFSCYGARQTFAQITSSPVDNFRVEAWSLPVRALGYYANGTLLLLGMGKLCREVPSAVKRAILSYWKKAAKQPDLSLQLRWLYDAAALPTALHWAFESLSYTSVDLGRQQNPWMQKNDNCAEALLRLFFRRQDARFSRDPMQLDIQAFGSAHLRCDRSKTPRWMSDYLKNPEKMIVRYSHLLLSRNLTLGEWYEIGEIKHSTFKKDAFLLAYTLRVQALIESTLNAEKHPYVEALEDRLSAITEPWELSRLVRFRMIGFFSVKPGCPENTKVLFALCRRFISLIQEFSELSAIYYHYLIAEALIRLKPAERCEGVFGETSIADLRGQFAKNLYCRVENEEFPEDKRQWEALLRYFLNHVRDSLKLQSVITGGTALQAYWEQQAVSGDLFRSALIPPAQWSPLTDRAWVPVGDELLTASSGVQIRRSASQKLSKWDFIGPEHLDGQSLIGVVLSSQKQQDRFHLCLNCSDGVLRRFLSQKDFPAGTPVLLTLEAPGSDHVRFVTGLLRGNLPDEAVRVRFTIEAEKLSLWHAGRSIKLFPDQQLQMLRYWNADLSEFFENKRKLSGSCAACLESGNGLRLWKPVEQNYIMLLVNVLASAACPDQSCTLTYIGPAKTPGCLLFSEQAGSNYALDGSCWKADSLRRLEEQLARENCCGLRVRVRLANVDGFPLLALCEEAFDRRNLCWRDQFVPEQILRAEWDGSCWSVPNTVPELTPEHVLVRLPVPANAAAGLTRDVLVKEHGWSELQQRLGVVEAAGVAAKSLAPLSRKQLCALLRVKAGDVLTLQSAQLLRDSDPYYLATLDSGLPVFCAVESVSFKPGRSPAAMIQGRKCIVDNVFCRRDQSPARDAAPIECPSLRSEIGEYAGLLTRYSAIIRKQSPETDQVQLRVLLDAEEGPIEMELPAAAFTIQPAGLGDLVRAKWTGRGWSFLAERRVINVRALWELDDRRGTGDTRITGLNLGIVSGSLQIGSALATQELSAPVLRLWDPDPAFQGLSSQRCGTRPGSGSIKILGPRFSDRRVFPYAAYTNVVEYSDNENHLIGEAENGSFKAPHTVWNVKAALYLVNKDETRRLVDLRRVFVQSFGTAGGSSPSNTANAELWRNYRDWLDRNDPHVFGSLTPDACLKLQGLEVPTRIPERPDEQPPVEWTRRLKLTEPLPARVAGRPYSTADIRAKLIADNGVWTVSIREADPLLVNEELLRLFNLLPDDRLCKDFYYAGTESGSRLLFEWGYGWLLSVRRQDVLDENGKQIYSELFYGDRISAFSVVREEDGEFGWKLVARRTDIHWELASQVWHDARENVMQLLRVKNDTGSGEVTISDVSVTGRQFRQSNLPRSGWSFKRVYSARFDDNSLPSLREQLPEGESIVLAELDPARCDKDSPVLEFHYLSFDMEHEQLQRLQQKVLCLTAGLVARYQKQGQSFGITNDYSISLFLPNETPDLTNAPRLRVQVLRRDFSLDESVLRTMFHSNPEAFLNCNMMVRLSEIGWMDSITTLHGSVKSVPLRSTESLRAWLEGRPEELVTVASASNESEPSLCAELFPGILFRIPQDADSQAPKDGTLASLRLSAGSIRVETVLPGDIRYFPEDIRRPVELIIMDGVLNRYKDYRAQRDKLDDEERRQKLRSLGTQFTVAEFPQIKLNHPALLDALIRQAPPRLALVSQSAGTIYASGPTDVCAGYLSVSPQTNLPTASLVAPEERESALPWSRLSFRDGSVEEIAAFVRAGHWRYHEWKTAVFLKNENRMQPQLLAATDDYRSILVFFQRCRDGSLTLRYAPDTLQSCGLSARGLIENGVCRRQKPEYLSVAASTDTSVWVEAYPGKVVELPRSYLFLGKQRLSLDRLIVSVFGPGDSLRFQQEGAGHGARAKLVLSGVRFGLRSVFRGARRMILPVCWRSDAASQKNFALLGAGPWTIRYPLPSGAQPEILQDSLVLLNENNDLCLYDPETELRYGDCTLMYVQGRSFTLAAYCDRKVRLSRKESDWGSAAWLLHLLSNPAGSASGLFNGVLPVKIVGTHENFVFVAYPAPPLPAWNSGDVLCCICMGCFHAEDGMRLVLRSGCLLLQVPAQALLPGVDEDRIAIIADRLSGRIGGKTHSFIITKTEDGWKAGLGPEKSQAEREITLLDYVPEADGILCRDKKDVSLLWLPFKNSCRLSGVDGSKVWEQLARQRDRTAASCGGCVVSLNDTLFRRSFFNRLDLRRGNYRVLLKEELSRDEKGYTYLGEFYPYGELVILKSESACPVRETALSEADIVHAELLERKPESIVAIPRGKRRERIYLSDWMLSAFREACNREPESEFYGQIDFTRFRNRFPDRFRRYREAAACASSDLVNNSISFTNSSRSDEELLVYSCIALTQISRRGNQFTDHPRLKAISIQALLRWLSGPGKWLASGFHGDCPQEPPCCDLAPALSAVILLNLPNKRLSIEQRGELQLLAAHLTRMLGFACGNSVHQELLLRVWLMRKNHKGLWARLQKLSLGGDAETPDSADRDPLFDGMLSATQKKRLVELCGNLIRNYPDMEDEKLTAMALLHAVGQPIDYTEFLRLAAGKGCCCMKLSPLGRMLTPPKDNGTGSVWTPPSTKLPQEIFERMTQEYDLPPIGLVSSIPIPISDAEQAEALQLVQKAIAALTQNNGSRYAAGRAGFPRPMDER